MGEQYEVGVRLKGDGSGLVGETKSGVEAMRQLEDQTRRTGAASEDLARRLERWKIATGQAASSVKAAKEDVADLDRELEQFLLRADRTYLAQQRLDQGNDLLARGLKAGLITHEQHDAMLARLARTYGAAAAGASSLGVAAGVSAKQLTTLAASASRGDLRQFLATSALATSHVTGLGAAALGAVLGLGAAAGALGVLVARNEAVEGSALRLSDAWTRLAWRVEDTAGIQAAGAALSKVMDAASWLIDHADAMASAITRAGISMIPGGAGVLLAMRALPDIARPDPSGASQAEVRRIDAELAGKTKSAVDLAGRYDLAGSKLRELTEARTRLQWGLEALRGQEAGEDYARVVAGIAAVNAEITRLGQPGGNLGERFTGADLRNAREQAQAELKVLNEREEVELRAHMTRLKRQDEAEAAAQRRDAQLAREAQAVREAIDPWQAYAREQQELRVLLDENRITLDEYHQALALAAEKAAGPMRDFGTETSEIMAAVKDAVESNSRAMSRELAHFALSGERSFQRLEDAANRFAEELLAIQIQKRMMDPLLDAGTSFLDDILGGIGGGNNGPLTDEAGFTGVDWGAVELHGGGIAGAEGVRRLVHPSHFAGAPRFHNGRLGIGPDEMPAILRRDEGVFTPEQMRAMGGSQIYAPLELSVDARGAAPGVEANIMRTLRTQLPGMLKEHEQVIRGIVHSGYTKRGRRSGLQ